MVWQSLDHVLVACTSIETWHTRTKYLFRVYLSKSLIFFGPCNYKNLTYHHFSPTLNVVMIRKVHNLTLFYFMKSRDSMFLSLLYWSGDSCLMRVATQGNIVKWQNKIEQFEDSLTVQLRDMCKMVWKWKLAQYASNPLKYYFSCLHHNEPILDQIWPTLDQNSFAMIEILFMFWILGQWFFN